MKLRSVLTASAAVIALSAGSTAQAANYYLSVFGGISTFDDEIVLHDSGSVSLLSATNVFTGPVAGGTLGGLTGLFTYFYTINLHLTTASFFYGTSNFSWEDDFDTGFVVGAAIGRDLVSGFRGELELAYRQADVSGGASAANNFDGRSGVRGYGGATYNVFKYTYAGPGTSTVTSVPIGLFTLGSTTFMTTYGQPFPFSYNLPAYSNFDTAVASSGDLSVWSLMANVWLDFDLFGMNPDSVTTFAGGGIGIAQLELEYKADFKNIFGMPMSYSIDDSAQVFAYQLGAGIGFDLGGGVVLSAQYRWFGTSDADLGNTDMRMESHNAIIGLTVPLAMLTP